ncbi:MAG: DUF167 family protein [Sphingomonadaceae bacterium]
MSPKSPVRREGGDILLAIKGKAGARRDAILGVEGDAVRIAVAAVAEQGRATERILRHLAKAFGVPRRQVELISGEFSPMKRVRILQPAQIPPELTPLLDPKG